MPQSLTKCYVHIVFSTKDRANLIPKMRLDDVHAYIGGIINGTGCHSICVGGTENHVHILCALSRTISISELVRTVKANSSKWIHEHLGLLRFFHWQEGYGLFSISHSHVEAVRQYIMTQEEHHRGVSFKDEYLRLLQLFQIEYNEQYVWD